MRWLILVCLTLFAAERIWLFRDCQAENAVEGLGWLAMAAMAILAVCGQAMLIWRG